MANIYTLWQAIKLSRYGSLININPSFVNLPVNGCEEPPWVVIGQSPLVHRSVGIRGVGLVVEHEVVFEVAEVDLGLRGLVAIGEVVGPVGGNAGRCENNEKTQENHQPHGSYFIG